MEEATEEEISALDLPSDEPELIETKDIPLGQITELDNIRQTYHDIEGLAESMHLNGQLQPCWVRPSNGDRPYELIFGYRRKRAAELLEWETVRCEVRAVKDGDEMAKVFVENFQREDPSPVAEARAIQTLKDQQGLTNIEVSRMLGCDPSQISHRLSLLKLAIPKPEPTPLIEAPSVDEEQEAAEEPVPDSSPDDDTDDRELVETMESEPESSKPDPAVSEEQKHFDILAKVETGELSASVAEVATGLESREDQEKLARLAIANGWSVKRAQNWVKSIKENVVDPEEKLAKFGELEMIKMEDVTALPYLEPREFDENEEKRLLLYSQLRNYMDREVTDYIEQKFNIPYENLWDYVTSLTEDEVTELSKRMLRRYIASAHRFPSLEIAIKDEFGSIEISPDPTETDQLSLPGAEDDILDMDEEMFMLPEIE